MQCLGRTQSFKRCNNTARKVFCHHHRFQGWFAGVFCIGVVGTVVGLYSDLRDICSTTPRFVYETEGNLSKAKRDLEVLESHIVDANKGFMRIRISKEFLNYKFSIPITLRYKSGRYEPVTLTFKNNPTRGPGIIVTSPEREKQVACHLFDGLKFRGFGPPTFAEDLVLRLYYNNKMAFFKAESGLIEFLNTPHGGYKPPPIFPGHLYMEYFVELSQEEKARGRSDFEELKKWFEIHRPTQ